MRAVGGSAARAGISIGVVTVDAADLAGGAPGWLQAGHIGV